MMHSCLRPAGGFPTKELYITSARVCKPRLPEWSNSLGGISILFQNQYGVPCRTALGTRRCGGRIVVVLPSISAGDRVTRLQMVFFALSSGFAGIRSC